MTAATLAFATPPGVVGWKRWLLYSAVARIVIFCVLAAGSMAGAARLLTHFVPSLRELPPGTLSLSHFAIQAACMVGAYVFLVRVVERRRPVELLPARGLGQLAAGALLGAALMSLTVALLWMAGSYRVIGMNSGIEWWVPLLTIGLGAAIAEEIAFRGVLYRIVEEGAGTWVALVVSALFFGAVHLGNPAATAWSSAAIAIEAGLLLGLSYHLTRSLPLCIGLHLGWNFTQGTVFGIPVSGTMIMGWLISVRPGPDWLTGGLFGAEASVLAVAVCTLLSAWLLARAWRHKTLVPLRRGRHMMETQTSGEAPC